MEGENATKMCLRDAPVQQWSDSQLMNIYYTSALCLVTGGNRGVEPLAAEGCNQSHIQAAVKVKGLLSVHV